MRLWMFGSDVGGGDWLEKHLLCETSGVERLTSFEYYQRYYDSRLLS